MTRHPHPSPVRQWAHLINRRQALLGLGGAGLAALLAACGKDSPSDTGGAASSTTTAAGGATSSSTAAASGDAAALLEAAGSCAVVPELTEGPYYIDADAVRSDIREDREGTPLRVAIRVRDYPGCTPVANAVVDVWHCDAGGLYSGYGSEGTAGERFLRGIQVTDGSGRVEFDTLYPGFYRGRTIHVHFKIHLDERTAVTSQLFFPEEVNDRVMATSPYDQAGPRDTRNSTDSIFSSATVLDVVADGGGYASTLVIGVSA